MRRLASLAALTVLATFPARAQSAGAPDSLLNHLVGRWVLRGTIAGKATVHDVTCAWVLGSEYIQMHEVSRERTPAGAPAYEAFVYVVRDPHTKEYAALWLDNTDANAFDPAGVGHARASGDSVVFLFTSSATDHVHTTLAYRRPSDTWEWRIDNEQSGAIRPFARVTLTRQ
jgi:hypothetical protein